MQNDENWESEIDWSRRTSVVITAAQAGQAQWACQAERIERSEKAPRVPSGPIFYDFVKTQAIPALDEGLRQMAAAKAESERKLQRWGAIAERAANLSDCFAALTGEPDFMRMVHDFDEGTKAIFEGESIPSIGAWLIIGKRLTDAMKNGSAVPTKYENELNLVNREIAAATSVRNILRSFVSASDNDYRLRCAPERFRTRVFRDLSQDFGDIISAASQIDLDDLPATVNGVTEALKVIIDVARTMQGICRRAKKDIKRHGGRFWSKLDEWNAMRSAV